MASWLRQLKPTDFFNSDIGNSEVEASVPLLNNDPSEPLSLALTPQS